MIGVQIKNGFLAFAKSLLPAGRIISTKLKNMQDLFKKLGEITKPEKQCGFFDLPEDTRCIDKSHEPPTHIHIPQWKAYRHVCPSCGKVTDLIPPQISF